MQSATSSMLDADEIPAGGKRSRRLVAVLDLLAEERALSLHELSRRLKVSTATMRRDLATLAEQRLIIRTHGGARLDGLRGELPIPLRGTRHTAAKAAIADAVAALIPQQRIAVALSGGTTTASVASALSGHNGLTIVTNSLSIAQQVSTMPQLTVMMTGGILRPESLELVGALAENTFTTINVAVAVLGADGVSATGGITTHDETEARANRAMATHAQRLIVAADGSKVGTLALAKMADPAEIDVLVTDSSADAAEIASLRAAGVEVVQVEP